MPAQVAGVFVAVAAAAAALAFRYQHDQSRPGRIIAGLGARGFDFISVNLYLMAFTAIAVPLCFLAFSLRFPMQDEAFAAIDQAMGFDWHWLLRLTNDHPALGKILIWSYDSFVVQMFVLVALLSIMGRTHELWDFAVLVTLTCLITIVISGLVPSVGPYAYYNPAPASFDALNQLLPGVGRFHVANVVALQSGQLPVLDLAGNHGLVTFPSYHAVLALTLTYAVRGIRVLFIPALVVNGLMLVSTLPVGGHYFVDLVGGLAIFLSVVALLDYLNGRVPMWSRLQVRLTQISSDWACVRGLASPQI
ncbi:MAG: phosphatase PAP2 family protein [Hyphomicrobium sp.]